MPYADPADRVAYEIRRAEKRKQLRKTDETYRLRESDRRTCSRYGITLDKLAAIRERAGGRCELCGDPTSTPHLDHCHTTRHMRGVLCPGCNTTLHWFENADWMRRARKYLDKYGA